MEHLHLAAHSIIPSKRNCPSQLTIRIHNGYINMTRANGQPTAEADERKERRRASNRRSARKSRYRENVFTLELQKTVSELSKKNEELRAENEAFRQEVVALKNLMGKTKTPQWDTVSFIRCWAVVASCVSCFLMLTLFTFFMAHRAQTKATH